MYNVHSKFSRLSVTIALAKNFTGEIGTVEKKSADKWPFGEKVVNNMVEYLLQVEEKKER